MVDPDWPVTPPPPFAWLVKTRRDPSRKYREVRVHDLADYGYARYDDYTPPPFPFLSTQLKAANKVTAAETSLQQATQGIIETKPKR